MESMANSSADGRDMASGYPAGVVVKRRKRGRPTKPRPLTREALDSRTTAAKMWDSLAASIIADAGGESEISTVQRTLINAFCGVAIRLNDLNTKGLLGQPVDLSELSLVASTLTRLASRIGVARVSKDVTPSLAQYIEHLNKQTNGHEVAP
jgi:hypothetical protein